MRRPAGAATNATDRERSTAGVRRRSQIKKKAVHGWPLRPAGVQSAASVQSDGVIPLRQQRERDGRRGAGKRSWGADRRETLHKSKGIGVDVVATRSALCY